MYLDGQSDELILPALYGPAASLSNCMFPIWQAPRKKLREVKANQIRSQFGISMRYRRQLTGHIAICHHLDYGLSKAFQKPSITRNEG